MPLPTQSPPLRTLFSHPLSLTLTIINIPGPGAEEKAKRTASPGWLGPWTSGRAKMGSLQTAKHPRESIFLGEWALPFLQELWRTPFHFSQLPDCVDPALGLGGTSFLKNSKRNQKKIKNFS